MAITIGFLLVAALFIVFGLSMRNIITSKTPGSPTMTTDEKAALIKQAYDAAYTRIDSAYKVDEKIGTIEYAANGKASDGTEVMAVFVKSSTELDVRGAQNLGYDSQYPSAYSMVIVISRANNKVIAYRVIKDGTKKPDYFTVPAEKIDAYKTVVISSETAFDNFTGGLVIGKKYETMEDVDDIEVITGTSIVYTGATVKGTFSGQLVNKCFQAAARFYMNVKQSSAQE
jgi:hypothetical protein